MSLSQYSIILQSDISSIISRINAETTARNASGTVSTPSQFSKILASTATSIQGQLSTIASSHTNSTAGIVTHSGCPSNTYTPTSLQTYGLSFIGGTTKITASDIAKVNTDITNLENQCNCNSNICTTVSCGCNSNGCTCNASVCTCNATSSYCSGNAYSCSCQYVCDNCYNQGSIYYSFYICTCNGVCSCVPNCNAQNTCYSHSACYSHTTCTCNTTCQCEFN